MSSNDSDITCVRNILSPFKRKASPNRLAVDDANRSTKPVATKLMFYNESLEDVRGTKKMKSSLGESLSTSKESTLDISVDESPWKNIQLKRELIDAKTKIGSLETRVSQLHALRRELEVVFEAEKNSLLQQQGRDQMMIQTLENRIAQLRKRESDVFDSNILKQIDLEDQNLHLQQINISLSKEKAKLTDEILELKRFLRNAESKHEDYDVEIKKLKSLLELKDSIKQQSSTDDSSTLALQNEKLFCELKAAKQTIQDMEYQLGDSQEASAIVKAQQQKLLKMPEMERELKSLKNYVDNLRDAVHLKLLLEEEVAHLRQKCATSDEQIQRLVQLEAQKQLLESKLEDWTGLVKDFCSTAPDGEASPSLMRKYLQEMQQSELLLSSEVAELQTKLKSCKSEESKAETEISRLTLEVSRLKTTQEQQGNLIRRWQKKLALITGERNSYREQLDSYEKELTVSVASQQQSSQPRVEALEKSLDGYRELVEKLEADLTAALGQGGSIGLLERLRVLSVEKDALVEENLRLQRCVDELQLQMENQVLKGDFNPLSTRVLHLRMNPVANAETEREKEMDLLKSEVAKLQERVKVLQEGERDDVTCKVERRLATSNSQEVQELREQIKSADLMMQRLKEAFKKTSSEFRDCVYNLLGYKVDRLQNKGGLFRLSSMYAESPSDYLLFKMQENCTFTLLETPFSESVGDLIDTHLRQQGSLPAFHAAVTMDLLNRQSIMMPSTSADDDEPIVVLD